MGSAPAPRAATTDSSLRSTAVAPPPITCFKCQGKGHRASQCPSSNLLIGLEDDAPDYQVGDDVVGDDVYVADDGLEEECLDPDVIGAIEITPAVSSHLPTAHQEALVASVVVPTPSRDGPLTRSLTDPTRGDDVLGEDVYIAADGLEEDCLDSDVLGYIKITSAASPHSPSAPHGSPVVSLAVPSPNSGTPGLQPPDNMHL